MTRPPSLRNAARIAAPLALTCMVWGGQLQLEDAPASPERSYTNLRLKNAFAENPSYPDTTISFSHDKALAPEAYRNAVNETGDQRSVTIAASDERGFLYGSLSLLEQLRAGGDAVQDVSENARFPFRALKFNLPWVSYRTGDAISAHEETCRDLAFWEAFMDMMVENRFNALTLWSLHPFHLMIRNETYPEACELTDAELAEWQRFWRGLFALAKQRGIETYIVNWNVFVSPAFAAHHDLAEYCQYPSANYIGPGEKADIVKDYTRTTVTQLIDSYPNLTGLGVSLGERMENFTPNEREEWIQDTFVAGMAEASRPIRFIHRLPFSKGSQDSGAPGLSTEALTRQAIESLALPTTVLTEAKFNWSHGHSSPELIKIHGGKMGDTYWNPPPRNYKIHWMVRNEDFFALRWAEPDFVRDHVRANGQAYVGGYYLGSECYIPARDYLSRPEYAQGYAFERQWLYYMIWGRLLYNPELSNQTFAQACKNRFGEKGDTLFKALQRGSRMPLRLASFFNSTWDFTLYSEGFLSIRAKSNPQRLITVEELIKTRTLDPNYVSIKDYIKENGASAQGARERTSPLDLAAALSADGNAALQLIESLPPHSGETAFALEVADARAWAHLSLYFSEKLQAAVALALFRDKADAAQGGLAVQHLERALEHWKRLAAVTDAVYQEMPLAQVYPHKKRGPDPRRFHWKRLLPAVRAELETVRAEVALQRM